MHNIGKSCKIIRFEPVLELGELESEFLEEYFDVVAVDYTDDGLEQYVCYAPLNFDSEQFKKTLKEKNFTLPKHSEEILESKNWLTENVIKFPPFEIGEFLIYGIHEATCPETTKIPVQVYAATAFGSEHQTTKMCLTSISELKKLIPTPNKILDMGTGSGILSIASAKIWNNQPQIISADIDSESVDVTQNNSITNNVEKNIIAILSDGYTNSTIKDNAPFDIILANILANPLKMMTEDAYSCLKKDGYYLISGFIENQKEDIINHHTSKGFKLVKTYQIDNWCASLLQK